MAKVVVVKSRYRITLPKEIMKSLKIKEGNVLFTNFTDNFLVLSNRNSNAFDATRNFLPENFESVLKKIHKVPN